MADDVEQKSKTELQYRQLGELNIGDENLNNTNARNACNLLTVANLHGYIFVGTSTGFKVFTSAALLSASKNQDDSINSVVCDVTLRNAPHWIAVSSDNLSLAVCSSGERGLQMLFFDVRCLINKQKPTKTPFCSITLAKESDVRVCGMQWNPSTEFTHLLAICLNNGSFFILSITDSIKEIGQRPKDFGATSVCWSPKGKQIVIGKKDGVLLQMTPKLEVKRTVAVCPNIDIRVQVCNVLWLSTYQFAVAYVRADDLNSAPNLFLAHVPSRNEARETSWTSYEDPCYGGSEDRVSQYYLPILEKWEMFSILSSNSSETSLMGKNLSTNNWGVWSLDDDATAILPIGKDNEDTSPFAAVFITTDVDDILIDVATEKSCGPMPVLVILTNEGKLLPFQFINQMAGYPSHTEPPKVLTVDGERNAIGNRGSSLSGENSSLPAKPANLLKQKILMKPNTMATSTPIAPKFKTDLPSAMTPITSAADSTLAAIQTGMGESFLQTPTKPPLTLAGISQKPPLHPSFATKQALAPSAGGSFMPQPIAPFNVERQPASNLAPKIVHVAQSAPKLIQQPASKPPPAYKPSQQQNADPPAKRKVTAKSNANAGLMSRELSEVIGSFERELSSFQQLVQKENVPTFVEDCLGSNQTRTKLKKEVAELTSFKKDVVQNTKELHGEISELGRNIAESLNAIQSAKTEEVRQKSESYKSLLYDRPLNMNDQKKVKTIKEMYQYLRQNVREADSALDMQWEKSQSNGNQRRRMQGGPWQIAYQALTNNTKIRHEMEMKITILGQTLDKLRLAKASSLLDRRQGIRNQQLYSPMEFSPAANKSSNLQRLADEMLLKNEDRQTPQSSPNLTDKSRKTSAKKMAQLAKALSARKTTPVRKFTAAPKRLSRNQEDSDLSAIGYSRESSYIQARSATPRKSIDTPISELATTSEEPTPTSEQVPSPLPEVTKPAKNNYFTQGAAPVHSSTQPQSMFGGGGKVGSPLTTNTFGFGKVEVNRNEPSPVPQFGTDKAKGITVKVEASSKPGFSFPSPTPAMTALPQGSATLGYGAPETSFTKPPQNRPKFTEKLNEAASNLNNPPKVVNVKDMKTEAGAFESYIPPLPQKFQPKSNVPDGAVAVVQTVLNTANAEQMKKQTSFFPTSSSDKPSASVAPSKPVVATITKPLPPREDPDNTAAPLAISFNNTTVGEKTSVFGGFSFGAGNSKETAAPAFGTKSIFGGTSAGLNTGGLMKSASIGGFGSLATKPQPTISNKPGFFTSASDKNIPAMIGNTPKVPLASTNKSATPQKQTAPLLASPAPDKTSEATDHTKTAVQVTPSSSTAGGPSSTPSKPLTPSPEPEVTSSFSLQSTDVSSYSTAATTLTVASPATTAAPTPANIFGTAAPVSKEASIFGAQVGKATAATGSVFGSSSGFGFGLSSSASQPAFGTAFSNAKVFGALPVSSTLPEEATSTSTTIPSTAVASTVQTTSTVTATSAGSISGFGTLATSTTSVTTSFGSLTTSTAGPTTGFGATSSFGTLAASTPGATTGIGSLAASTVGTTTGFGTLPASTAGTTTEFGTLAASTAGTTTGFGTLAASTAGTTTGFGAPSTAGTTTGFGSLAASTAGTTTGFGSLAASTDGTTTGFGAPSTPGATTGFGSLAASTAGTTTGFGAPSIAGTNTGFGALAAPTTASAGFGGISSGFGAATTSASTGFGAPSQSVFGATTKASGFGTSTFGQAPAFGSTQPSAAFGQQQQPSVFGETKPQPTFGATAVPAEASSGFGFGGGGGGGFLSGLGGTAPKFGEAKNPFAANATVTVEQPANTSIFGSSSSTNRAFGGGFGQQSPSAFEGATTGGGGGSSVFGSGGANVAEQGFGAFNKPAQPAAGGFGSPPAFGGTPAFGAAAKFGSPPAFGGTSAFGGASSGFGNTSFGAPATQQPQQPTGAFAAFASNPTPGFGGFGSTNTNTGFGQPSNDQSKAPSFSGWR